MRKTYLVQIIIDIVVIFLGICNYIFPTIASLSENNMFFLMMCVYSLLNLCEFVFDNTRNEPLYMFFASGVCAFSGIFLRDYPENYVLSITVAAWTLMLALIKIISLKEIPEKKTNLFIIKLISLCLIIFVNVILSINIYYNVSDIVYMLGSLFLIYGLVELFCDFLTYLSDNTKFLKE